MGVLRVDIGSRGLVRVLRDGGLGSRTVEGDDRDSRAAGLAAGTPLVVGGSLVIDILLIDTTLIIRFQ